MMKPNVPPPRLRPSRSISLSLLALSALASSSQGTLATREEMRNVCANWLSSVVREQGDWGGVSDPAIASVEDLEGHGIPLAAVFTIAPGGFIVVPILRELPPVKAYSDSGQLDPTDSEGFAGMLRDVLAHRYTAFVERYGSLEAASSGDPLFTPLNKEEWTRLAQDPTAFLRDEQPQFAEAGPLLTSDWHQGEPYSALCPIGAYGWNCPTGCVATAIAQIMRYHQWPPQGLGQYSYWWGGDDSCGGGTPAQELSAVFSDPYDWAAMPDQCEPDSPSAQRAAVAELCYEVGVSVSMDYGACGSGSTTEAAANALVQYFGYHHLVDKQPRSGYSPLTWFAMIQDEIDGGRPLYYSIFSHAGVVDGWRDSGGPKEIHFNYGWGGPQTAWYTLDGIYGSPGPQFESMLRWIIPDDGEALLVKPDGSGLFPTIQAAIDATEDGDVITLADGVFRGPGNRDLRPGARRITIRSQSGDPSRCILDAEGSSLDPHQGFLIGHRNIVVQGMTIRNGYHSSQAGGIDITGVEQTVRNCVFTDCSTGAIDAYGCEVVLENCVFERCGSWAVYCNQSLPTIVDCTFYDNTTTALFFFRSDAVIRGCTFAGNSSSSGAIRTSGGTILSLENTIVVGTNGGGRSINLEDDDDTVVLACCDLWGNSGGDWVGGVADQLGVNGNISADPLFCETGEGLNSAEFWLRAESPCAPEANPDCGLIGAWPVSCSAANVELPASHPSVTLEVAPNPFTTSLVIRFGGDSAALGRNVRVQVLDVAGRTVRTLTGPHAESSWIWDGRDDVGRTIASGVYFVRVAAAGEKWQRRVLAIR